MNLKPSELEENGYELFHTLKHDELLSFIQDVNKHKNIYSISHKILTGLFFGTFIGIIVFSYLVPSIEITDFILFYFCGFFVAIALLPLHEYIHLVTYKHFGAKNTSIQIQWKQFVFLALAHEFVASKKEFIVIALAPFFLISSGLIFSMIFVPFSISSILLGMVLSHTLMCVGDFRMLGFFNMHPTKEIITFDDSNNKLTYFYAKDIQ